MSYEEITEMDVAAPPDKQDIELARLALQHLRKPDATTRVVRLQVEGLGSAVVVPEIVYSFLLVILEHMANGKSVCVLPGPKTASHRPAKNAFFRIMSAWGVSDSEAQIVLGNPSYDAYERYKVGGGGRLSEDELKRVSYVLGIYKALQQLFLESAQADAWIKKPNEAFGGASALERILGGQIGDLAAVHDHLVQLADP